MAGDYYGAYTGEQVDEAIRKVLSGETGGAGVPAGGSAGQVLAKKTGEDFDTQWVTPLGGGGSAGGVGQDVSGKDFPLADGTTATAESYAEIFNDYAERTYETVANDGTDTSVAAVGNIAIKAYAHAEGERTSALGEASHAEGFRSVASGGAAHAEGGAFTDKPGPQATGYAAHAEGVSTLASGPYSHAEGTETVASGIGAHAEGGETVASGNFSHAEGQDNSAFGNCSHAEGMNTLAIDIAGNASGYGCNTSGNSHTVLIARVDQIDDETAEIWPDVSRDFGIAWDNNKSKLSVGDNVYLNGGSLPHPYSYPIKEILDSSIRVSTVNPQFDLNYMLSGGGTPAVCVFSGINDSIIAPSHAEGSGTNAIEHSHAEGDGAVALHTGHAEGCNTLATNMSHAEGTHSEAIGSAVHCEGACGVATGFGNHSEGVGCFSGSEVNILCLESPTENEAENTIEFTLSNSWGLLAGFPDTWSEYIIAGKTKVNLLAIHPTIRKRPQGIITKVEGQKITVTKITYSYGEFSLSDLWHTAKGIPGDDNKYVGIIPGYNSERINGNHAEGYCCVAGTTGLYGNGNHAQGEHCIACGSQAFAGGYGTISNQSCSFAYGVNLIAPVAHSATFGTLNAVGNTDESEGPVSLLTIGNGAEYSSPVRSNVFRVDTWGDVYAKRNYNSSGADYAELFQWLDNNPKSADRCGLFVTLQGDKIKLAGPDSDYILGIVSGSPSVVGDVYDDQWQGMYLSDIYGRPIMEEVEVPEEAIEVPVPEDPEKTIRQMIMPAHKEIRQKLNPAYDPTAKYIPRSKRPEWDAVGMLGKLVARDDGSCQVDGYCAPGRGGVATHSAERTAFRVIERLDERHIRVLIK